MDELRLKLEQENFAAKETSRDRMVIVESGDDVDWNRYFKVMTAVSNAGGIVAIVEAEEENGAAK
jgi:biopolymer transport protein ExbD